MSEATTPPATVWLVSEGGVSARREKWALERPERLVDARVEPPGRNDKAVTSPRPNSCQNVSFLRLMTCPVE